MIDRFYMLNKYENENTSNYLLISMILVCAYMYAYIYTHIYAYFL